MIPRPRRALRAVVGAMIAATALLACGDAQEAAWVEQVEALRVEAAALIDADDLEGAEAKLLQAAQLAPPSVTPQTTSLREDAWFALGHVRFAQRDLAGAREAASAGLALSSVTDGPTIFRANLFALRAMAYEALGQAEEAMIDYERAQAMHQALFDRALAAYEEDQR